MKIGEILRDKQENVYSELNKKPKRHRKRRRGKNKNNKESLSFLEIENLMKHDSYTRGKGGSIKQKRWGE